MFLDYGGDKRARRKSYNDASFYTNPDDSKSQSGYLLKGAEWDSTSPTILSWSLVWRKYALEAIIKLLFISLIHDKCLLFMLELY